MIDLKKAVRAAIISDTARVTLCSTVSVAALAALASAPVLAATAGDDLEEIVVSGYRKSLQTARDLKRDSDVLVDSVTAADIGELPDRSVSEALQRIPGVVINRFAAGVDPDHFSVEGSGVTIRGLSFVHSELNSRETFTANNGRALSFADVPAELMGGVDVFKSPSADRIEGGIGGVVNLRTRLPFDGKGLTAGGSLEQNYGDFKRAWTPSGSLFISDRWETGIGDIGALGSYSYSDIKSRADKLQISNFAVRGLQPDGFTLDPSVCDATTRVCTVPAGDKKVYFPRGAVGGSQEFDRARVGVSAALQWRSPSERWEAVAQFMKSDARESWTEHTTEIATDNVTSNGDSQAEPNTRLAFDSSNLFASGYITGTTGWRDDQRYEWNGGPARRTPINGLQSNNITRGVEQKFVTEDMSGHITFKPTDALKLELDYQHVLSTVENIDVGLWTSSYQDAYINLNGGLLPTVSFKPVVCLACSGNVGTNSNPAYFAAGHQSYADPYNSFYRSTMDHIEQSDGQMNAFRLDGTYDIGGSWLSSIKVGFRHAERDNNARFSKYNWGALSEQWGTDNSAVKGNDGPVWLDQPIPGNGNKPLNTIAVYNFPNFFKGATQSPFGADGRLYYSLNPARNYGQVIRDSYNINNLWDPDRKTTANDWVALADRARVIPGTPFTPEEINPVSEKNDAAYLMANLSHKFSNNMKLSGNVGVRFTRTHREAIGGQFDQSNGVPANESSCNPPPPAAGQPAPQLPSWCFQSDADKAAARAFFNDQYTRSTESVDYTYTLPSLNLKLDVGNGLQYRFDYFKGVSAPDFGFTRNDDVVSFTQITVKDLAGNILSSTFEGASTAGNPKLKPVTSDNFDLSVEWYFSNVGQLSAAVFYKNLKDVISNGTQRINLTNNSTTVSVVRTQPENAKESGKIKGIEIGYQQSFDFLPSWANGLGIAANWTYVTSSGVKQSTLSNTDPDVGAGRVATIDTSRLPLQGLSKYSYNITPFYQKGPVEIRFAYNWRSAFLLTTRDVIVPFQPIMNEATGQLDASAFFSLNKNLKLGLQVANVTNEVTKTTAVIDNNLQRAPRGFYVNDTRYTLGLRWSL